MSTKAQVKDIKIELSAEHKLNILTIHRNILNIRMKKYQAKTNYEETLAKLNSEDVTSLSRLNDYLEATYKEMNLSPEEYNLDLETLTIYKK